MKKIISVALIVAMCATMMLVPTVASAAIKSTFSWDNGTANGGLAGKTADEYAALKTISAYNGSGGGIGAKSFNFSVKANNYSFSDSDYFVLDVNILPKSGVAGVYTCPDGGLYSVGSKNIVADRWNHVRVVVKEMTADEMTAAGTYQPLTLYVNGKLIGTKALPINTADKLLGQTTYDCGSGFRFNVGGDNNGQVYIADAVVSENDVNEAPAIPVVAAGENYIVNADKTITFADGAVVTVKDIKDANPGADIRVYWNDKFTSQVVDSYTLTKGNIVVIKKDNIYDYYTVNSGVPTLTTLAQDSDGSNFGSGKPLSFGNASGSGTVAGVGGKATDDKVVKILSKNADSFIQYVWGTANVMDPIPSNVLDYDWDKKIGSYTGYLVLEYSVFNVDCPVLQIKTDYGGVIVPDFGDSVPKNRWSRVRVVLDRTSTTTNTTYYTVFVDGKQVSAGSSTTLGALYTSGKRARNNIRIGITSSDANTQCTAYVDDVRIYESNGFVGEEPMITIDNGTCYGVSDSTIIYSNGCEIADIIENVNYGANNAKLNLFDADGNVVADAQSASILGVWGKSATAVRYNYGCNDMYRYYTFTEAPQKYDLVTSTPNLTNNSGKTEAVSEEVFGKTSAELKKVIIGKGNNFHNLSWKVPQPASQYVVYSVDMAPTEGITHIYFGADGHARMSLDAKVGQYLNANDWNNIQFVYDIINNTSDLHVNGVCISTGYPTKYVMGTSTCIRFIINGADNSYAYIDNLRVYELTPVEKPLNADNAIVHSIVNFEQFGDWSKATASQTAGPDGGDDTAAMIKANNYSGDGDDVYTGLFWDSNLYGSEKYVVYQADVRFGANASSFLIGSAQHEKISDNIPASNPKLKDGWNRITVVSEADTGINKTYINGIYDHSYESAIHRVKYDSKYNTIRAIAYAKDKTDTETEVISLDNVLVFRTNIEQVYGAPVTGSYSAEVGATFTADCGYGTLLVAAFNGDNMIEATYINVTSDNRTLTLKSEGATEYRAFIWDSIDEIKPMYGFIPVQATN